MNKKIENAPSQQPPQAPAAPGPVVDLPPDLQGEAARLEAKAKEAEANSPEVIVARDQAELAQLAVKNAAQLLSDLTKPIINDLVLARCPVPDDQYDQLMNVYATVIEKRWPGAADQWGPEVAAVILTGAILGPRIYAVRKAEAAEAAAAAKAPAKAPEAVNG